MGMICLLLYKVNREKIKLEGSIYKVDKNNEISTVTNITKFKVIKRRVQNSIRLNKSFKKWTRIQEYCRFGD
jgi:hypothetical protein